MRRSAEHPLFPKHGDAVLVRYGAHRGKVYPGRLLDVVGNDGGGFTAGFEWYGQTQSKRDSVKLAFADYVDADHELTKDKQWTYRSWKVTSPFEETTFQENAYAASRRAAAQEDDGARNNRKTTNKKKKGSAAAAATKRTAAEEAPEEDPELDQDDPEDEEAEEEEEEVPEKRQRRPTAKAAAGGGGGGGSTKAKRAKPTSAAPPPPPPPPPSGDDDDIADSDRTETDEGDEGDEGDEEELDLDEMTLGHLRNMSATQKDRFMLNTMQRLSKELEETKKGLLTRITYEESRNQTIDEVDFRMKYVDSERLEVVKPRGAASSSKATGECIHRTHQVSRDGQTDFECKARPDKPALAITVPWLSLNELISEHTKEGKRNMEDLFKITARGAEVSKTEGPLAQRLRCKPCIDAYFKGHAIVTNPGTSYWNCMFCQKVFSKGKGHSSFGTGFICLTCSEITMVNESNDKQKWFDTLMTVPLTQSFDDKPDIDYEMPFDKHGASKSFKCDIIIKVKNGANATRIVIEIDSDQHSACTPDAELKRTKAILDDMRMNHAQPGFLIRFNPSSAKTKDGEAEKVEPRERAFVLRDWIMAALRDPPRFPSRAWVLYLFYSNDNKHVEAVRKDRKIMFGVTDKAPLFSGNMPDWAASVHPVFLLQWHGIEDLADKRVSVKKVLGAR